MPAGPTMLASDPPEDGVSPSGIDEGYDFLNESGVLVPSDDEAETVSSRSFSLVEPNAEDVRSVAGTEHSVEDNNSEQDEHEEQEPLFLPSDSGMTTRADIRPAASTLTEKLSEVPGLDELHVSQPLLHSFGSQWQGVLGSSAASVDELRYSISKESMAWSGPFRIMFAGFSSTVSADPNSPENLIGHKIASALTVALGESQSGPSCEAVVPVSSFGSEASADCELIPSDIFLIKEAFSSNKTQHMDMLAQNSSVANLPNLAVMCHQPSERPGFEDRIMALFRTAMVRRGIPILHLVLSGRVNAQYSSFHINDDKSMHLSLNSSTEEKAGVMPVDINTFLHLDPMRLNCHLACIGVRKTSDGDQLTVGKVQGSAKADKQKWPTFKKTAYWAREALQDGRNRKSIVSLVGLALVMMLGAMTSIYGPTWQGGVHRAPGNSISQEAALNSAIESFKAVKTPNTTSISIVKPLTDILASKHDSKSIGAIPLVHPSSPSVNRSDEFTVHIIGDYHFVLTPPKRWLNLKRQPKLFIRIQRGLDEIKHESEKLVDGVWAVRVDRKDAYGILNVTVSTQSKPDLQQSIDVDFGCSWLKALNWADAADRALSIAQASTKNTSLELFNGLQLVRRRTKDITESAVRSATKVMQRLDQNVAAARQRNEERRKNNAERTAAVIDAVKKVDYTHPFKKARRNAGALRSKIARSAAALRSKVHTRSRPEEDKVPKKNGRAGKKACKANHQHILPA